MNATTKGEMKMSPSARLASERRQMRCISPSPMPPKHASVMLVPADGEGENMLQIHTPCAGL